MFVGHFAVALAAKRVAGRTRSGSAAADLVWPTLVLPGIEVVEVRPGVTAVTPLDFVHYPYSRT